MVTISAWVERIATFGASLGVDTNLAEEPPVVVIKLVDHISLVDHSFSDIVSLLREVSHQKKRNYLST
jgi:hypothetical protein